MMRTFRSVPTTGLRMIHVQFFRVLFHHLISLKPTSNSCCFIHRCIRNTKPIQLKLFVVGEADDKQYGRCGHEISNYPKIHNCMSNIVSWKVFLIPTNCSKNVYVWRFIISNEYRFTETKIVPRPSNRLDSPPKRCFIALNRTHRRTQSATVHRLNLLMN